MRTHKHIIFWAFVISALAIALLPIAQAAATSHDAAAILQKRQHRVTNEQRLAAAARAVKTLKTLIQKAPVPGGVPDFYNFANYANSPILPKFVDSLPLLGPAGANDLGQFIPVAVADTTSYPGCDYYEIGLVQYSEKMHLNLPPTLLRGYVQLNDPANPVTRDATGKILTWPQPQYMGPAILAQKNRPVRVKFSNLLPTGAGGNLFIPVDTSMMGAGMGPLGTSTPLGDVNYTQNRSSLHLHGGVTPWISDGTPHQWFTPAGEFTSYPKGVGVQNVPDMPDPGDGSMTFFYSNQQSARLMFYHDHALGITRLNVYAGEAAPYLLTDPTEQALIANGTIPAAEIPLVIQDKTFVDATTIGAKDPTWNWGSVPGTFVTGDLWFPHVYMPNQNPWAVDGVNQYGRWDYGPWFWPPWTVQVQPTPIDPLNPTGPQNPGVPNVSSVMEAFMDTPVVNGTAYPYLNVQPQAYRFRILNAADDRTWNLQLQVADPATVSSDGRTNTEVHMVPSVKSTVWPAGWGTPVDTVAGWPDPTMLGPSMIQIGTEGGFLPAPVVLPNIPIAFDQDPRSITVTNVKEHNLLLGPAERADVIVDFSAYAGKTLILYNDAPAPDPGWDTRDDYYTGNPDLTAIGGAPSTAVGFGPNTRTIMQIRVAAATPAAPFNVAALNAAFASTATTPGVFASSQDPIIVPQGPYNSAYNATFPIDRTAYARIADMSLTFTPMGTTVPRTVTFENKALHELFEDMYGRMNAVLGVEIPNTNGTNQTTIVYHYLDPPTDFLTDNITPMSPVLGDGTTIWKITHNGVDTHSMHFHLMNLQLINRVGWDGVVKPPDANELGWKETIRMNPLEDVIVAMRPVAPQLPFGIPHSIRPYDPTMPLGSTGQFTGIDTNGNPITVTNTMNDYGWEYVWHCHLLGHEEMDMMRPISFAVVTTIPDAPTGLKVALQPSLPLTSVLTWVDPTPAATSWGNPKNEIGFRISRSVNGGAFTLLENALANATSATDATLIAGNSYAYHIVAYNASGDSPLSNNASLSPPGAPTAVTAVGGNASAVVSFTQPVLIGGASITKYTVTSSPGGFTATGAASPITITGLTNGTSYTFTVTATNVFGTGPASAKSNAVVPATIPGAPTAVTAVGNYTSATLRFTAPNNGGAAITLYTATSSPGGLTATGTTPYIVLGGLTTGTTYTFTVTATNRVGTGPASAPSNSVKAITVPPGPPTAVSAVPGNASAVVSFTQGALVGGASVTSYTVTSSPGGITASGAASPITVNNLLNGSSYTFTVTATNSAGTSPASLPSASIKLAAVAPNAPTAVSGARGNSQVTVSFTAPVINGGSVITSYTATASPGGKFVSGAGSPLIVTGLTNGTSYTFTVTATNAVGTGPASTPSAVVVPSAPPGAPTGVSGVRIAAGQIRVSFTTPAFIGGASISNYTVTASPGGITASGTASPITVTGLTPGIAYTFTVKATNAAGTGNASVASASVVAMLPMAAPWQYFSNATLCAFAMDTNRGLPNDLSYTITNRRTLS